MARIGIRLALITTIVVTVLQAGAMPAHATYPGTNGRIVYSDDSDGNFDIYSVPSGGGAPLQLTSNSGNDEDPSYSRDGTHIYWDRELASGKRVIMVMKSSDGSGVKQLTSSKKDSWDPAPGPGKTMAFARTISGNSEIFVSNLDGSNVVQLTNTGRFADEPAWSPNGKTIAFTRSYHFFSAIFTMSATGQNKTVITPSDADYYNPSFSPDGLRIAVSSDLTTTSDIYTMNKNGSDIVQFTSAVGRQDLPKYSPDGTAIAYSTSSGGPSDIVTQPLAGGSTTQLTFDGVDNYPGSWQST